MVHREKEMSIMRLIRMRGGRDDEELKEEEMKML